MSACMGWNRWLWIHICEVVQGTNRRIEPATLEILMRHDVCLVACHCCSYRPNQAAMYWLFPFYFVRRMCLDWPSWLEQASRSRGI